MGKHFKKGNKAYTRQEIINMRREWLAYHRKNCKAGCICSLAQEGLPAIPNE